MLLQTVICRGQRLLSALLFLAVLLGLLCIAAPQAEAAGKKEPVVPSLAASLGLDEEPEAAIVSTKPYSELGYYYEVYSYDLDKAADIRTYCEKLAAKSAFRLLATTKKDGSKGINIKTYYYSYAGNESVDSIRTKDYLSQITEQDLSFDSFALAISVKEAPPIQTVVTFYYGNGVRFAGLDDAGGAKTCKDCGGTGSVVCVFCKGTGGAVRWLSSINGKAWIDCNACNGTGKRPCKTCGGTGKNP